MLTKGATDCATEEGGRAAPAGLADGRRAVVEVRAGTRRVGLAGPFGPVRIAQGEALDGVIYRMRSGVQWKPALRVGRRRQRPPHVPALVSLDPSMRRKIGC